MKKMILQIAKTIDEPADFTRIVYLNYCFDFSNEETIRYYGIDDNSMIHVVKRTQGGGGMENIYSNCKECLMKDKCPFHELFSMWNVHKLVETQKNAYLILCQRFKFPKNVVKAIEENNEDNQVRLGDIIHRIYHKNHNTCISQEKVVEIISEGKIS